MLGQELTEVSFMMSVFISFSAGILSFLSPCVLPIVPPYLAFMAGKSVSSLKNPTRENSHTTSLTFIAVSFVLGLSTVFIMLGLAAAALGSFFLSYQTEMGYISGGIVILFGLHFLGIFRVPLLNREFRFTYKSDGGGLIGAYFLGIAFAFGWTPCIGPILGAILSMSAQADSFSRGTALMAVYATGLGCPFLFFGVFFAKSFSFFSLFKKHLGKVEKVMGFLLILVGILLLSGGFTILSFWLLENFPILTIFG
ncbi:MAG: cytochrome c biogenesis protein CcdA [Paracoccaceae bacterium]|nr:cytochrome c biogenesis protein CcdA [Paracoccaceae bacterium]